MGEKTEPGSDNEPDLSVRTSVEKHSLRFNTSIVKRKKKSVITHIFETTRGYHEAGPCTYSFKRT